MNTSTQLQSELKNVLWGQPWYGNAVYVTLSAITFENAAKRPPGGVHTIAEIVLHMISWTEEVIDRINEKPASLPLGGDWPDPGDFDELKWNLYLDDLKLVNTNLLRAIQDFPEEKWDEPIIDEREDIPVFTYAELVRGLIQHHIYHQGQIGLLVRVLG
nr:DinB family protein [uncultured Mucilaginibacter sp.]